MHYQISVIDIQNITGIHIHQSKSGENEDVIVNIAKPKENIFLNQSGTKLSQIESSTITIGENIQTLLLVEQLIIPILKGLY